MANFHYWHQLSNHQRRSRPNMRDNNPQIILVLSTKMLTVACLEWLFRKKQQVHGVKFLPGLDSCSVGSAVLVVCSGEEAVLFSGHELSGAHQRHSCPCSQGLSSSSWTLAQTWKLTWTGCIKKSGYLHTLWVTLMTEIGIWGLFYKDGEIMFNAQYTETLQFA